MREFLVSIADMTHADKELVCVSTLGLGAISTSMGPFITNCMSWSLCRDQHKLHVITNYVSWSLCGDQRGRIAEGHACAALSSPILYSELFFEPLKHLEQSASWTERPTDGQTDGSTTR
jgi:hypothetical protein